MTVKCRDCGYLALRSLATRQLFEVEAETRETGTLPHNQTGPGPGGIHPPYMLLPPVCFRMVPAFRQEARKLKNGDDKALFNVIDSDHDCEMFIEWKQGWSPREHWEMFQAAELQSLKDRVAAQEKGEAERETAREDRMKQFQMAFENRMKWYMFLLAVAVLAWNIWKETAPIK